MRYSSAVNENIQTRPLTALIIAPIWPEPVSSAAGTHMLQIIRALQHTRWHIHFASTAEQSPHSVPLDSLNITTHHIQVNDSGFDTWISGLCPDIVIFEHFSMEEQFGWRTEKQCPDAMRILHTVDLHFLRQARQQALQREGNTLQAELHNTTALREIAAIYRSDLSLIISEAEMRLLREHFAIPETLVHYTPFMFEDTDISSDNPGFDERQHFVSIGNFRHPPNMDAVQWLHQSIWPRIRETLPKAELHIYGAYMPPGVKSMHRADQGFMIRDRAEDAIQTMQKARVCLAPLRFGAGLKGKLADAMLAGTPAVTTTIGAEGMAIPSLSWGGRIVGQDIPSSPRQMERLATAIASAAIYLYQNRQEWENARQAGLELIRQRFSARQHGPCLIDRISTIHAELQTHRNRNFIGQMLRHHQHRSTEFLSRWIEEKNKHRP